MNFRTQYTDYFPTLDQVSSDSETVPDMSLSVKDILRRFTRGTLTEQELFRHGEYDDDPDIDNPYESPTDLTDFEILSNRGQDILRDIESMASQGEAPPSAGVSSEAKPSSEDGGA